MFCIHCSASLPSDVQFCHACGKTVALEPAITSPALSEVMVSDAGPQIRPWVRYAARMIDIMFWSFSVLLLIGLFAPHLLNNNLVDNDYVLAWLVVVMWVFVEPLCLSVFGTTPGKWLLRIRLVYNGPKALSYGRTLKRSVMVWWRGLGAGVPIVNLVTMFLAFDQLKNVGQTSWDADGDFTVTHAKIGVGRAVVGFALIFFNFSLIPFIW